MARSVWSNKTGLKASLIFILVLLTAGFQQAFGSAGKHISEMEIVFFQNDDSSESLDGYLYENRNAFRALSSLEKQQIVFFIMTRIGTDAGATYTLVEVFKNDWLIILKYLHRYDEESLRQRGLGEKRIENYIQFINQLSARIEKGLPIL